MPFNKREPVDSGELPGNNFVAMGNVGTFITTIYYYFF